MADSLQGPDFRPDRAGWWWSVILFTLVVLAIAIIGWQAEDLLWASAFSSIALVPCVILAFLLHSFLPAIDRVRVDFEDAQRFGDSHDWLGYLRRISVHLIIGLGVGFIAGLVMLLLAFAELGLVQHLERVPEGLGFVAIPLNFLAIPNQEGWFSLALSFGWMAGAIILIDWFLPFLRTGSPGVVRAILGFLRLLGLVLALIILEGWDFSRWIVYAAILLLFILWEFGIAMLDRHRAGD